MSRSPLSKQVQPQPVQSNNVNPNVPSFVPMTTSGNPPPNLGINSSILGSPPRLTTMGPPTVRAMTPAVLSSGGHHPSPPTVPLLVKNQPSLLGNPPFHLLVHQTNPNVLPNRLPIPVYSFNLFGGNVPPPPSPLSPPTSFQTSEPSPSGCGVETEATEKVHKKRKRGCRGKESQRRRRNAKSNARRILAIDCEMVKVEGGKHSLAHCVVVDEDEQVLFDYYVKPNEEVIDYMTCLVKCDSQTHHYIYPPLPSPSHKTPTADFCFKDIFISTHFLINRIINHMENEIYLHVNDENLTVCMLMFLEK